ncbi:uncharacterized protein LOC141629961 [Silene latifolia]|uniref:uncharacterized protein LOC141629961 n=1 Tax=Silene latifolia TaxID=37657 RepID=UPI003D774932
MIWDAQKVGKVLNKDEDIYGGWDAWAEMCRAPFQLDTDMIFLPVLSGDGDHYSCVCINFLTEQIDYLDNRKYDDPIETLPYGGIARISANIMGKYLVSKGLSKGAKVSGFKIVNIEFSWQGQGYSRNDCGVFMMLHMMFYRGSPFECDLGKEDAMSLYRAEIAATLVLCDINSIREDILTRVGFFKTTAGHPLTRKLNAVKRKTDGDIGPESTKRARVTESEKPVMVVTPVAMRIPSGQALSAVKSHPRGKGDGLGCSLDCGRGGLNTNVVSKLLRGNQALIKDIKIKRKHVANYCLLDDHTYDEREQLVWYTRHATLRRKDIMSLMPKNLMSLDVIECWSILMNHLEKEEYGDHMRMSFFGIRHMDLLLRILGTFEQPGTQSTKNYDDTARSGTPSSATATAPLT